MNAAIRHGAGLAAVVLGLGAVAAGCLTRPVEHADPTTKTNVSIQVPNQAVDKIDLLFDIDNSASMGDKQQYLQQAIPLLIARLVTPNCVDTATPPNVMGTTANGPCPAGFKPEFPPVSDMHIGVVTSSLGTRLSDMGAPTGTVLCDPTLNSSEYSNLATHNDDKGELISRGPLTLTGMGTEGTVADATAGGYLYWFPTGAGTGPAPVITMNTALEGDFADLVSGAGIFGCGIESQLESWYRFLIQPDPYASLVLNPATNGGQARAAWSGVDTTILKQRHDFLRPDSLVVVVVLSDENDSEIDVRALNGTAYLFMHAAWAPPQGTGMCATNPDDPACTLSTTNYDPTASNNWGMDPNLRHVHMKAKYGVDAQFPISRYYLGLTSTLVPNRDAEYPVVNGAPVGQYQEGAGSCTNPLFAASLPDGTANPLTADSLCNLPVGPRANQKSNIFFAHIGGVPRQLLHFDPNNLANSQLLQADWVRILGTGAANYTVPGPALTHDYTGIDPHMIESYQDRTLPGVVNFPIDTSASNALAPSTAANNADPVNGREWVTDTPAITMQGVGHQLPVDRQYACIFPLAMPRDCTVAANQNSCDCPESAMGLSAAQIPPLCNPTTPTSQVAAKAYPTIRELLVTKLMGPQGIVASLCPDPTATSMSDPRYGYNPAVAVIVDRLKTALNSQCLPQKLGATDGGNGAVPCLVLVSLPATAGGTCKNPKCNPAQGLYGPGVATNSPANPPLDPTVLEQFCDTQEANYTSTGGVVGAGGDPGLQSVCMMYQLTSGDPNAATEFPNGGSCSSYAPPMTAGPGTGGGWCYVTGAAANGCPQAVQFSEKALPGGSVTYLQCIEESISVVSSTTTH